MTELYRDSNGNTVEVDTSVSDYIYQIRLKLDLCIEALRAISVLKNRDYNAFGEAIDIADEALEKIK